VDLEGVAIDDRGNAGDVSADAEDQPQHGGHCEQNRFSEFTPCKHRHRR
jgi:hypothetical protein